MPSRQAVEPHSGALTLAIPQKLLISLVLALALWLPRGLALDHFVAVDERSWLTRSGNFYLALTQGHWAATFQRYHPGVTTMWLGMGGFLWRYPDYPTDAANTAGQIISMSEGIEDFLKRHGHPPLDVLAAGRTLAALVCVGLLLLAFWLAVDLLGWPVALLGLLLLAFEPMLLGLTRMLHVDGLSSSFMLVSLLAYLRYRLPSSDQPGRRSDLALSGIMAGLAWLSKSPALFLIPFFGLVALLDLIIAWRRGGLTARLLWRTAGGLALWSGIGAAVFVALWPAMWVQPVATMQAIFSAAGEAAAEGHTKDLYFNGVALSGDPGPLFYPITYLWQTTPVTLAGLALAASFWLWGLGRSRRRSRLQGWQTVGLLLLFVLAFLAFMTLGAKKFARYLLPAYLPLDLAAAAGWIWALRLLASWRGEGAPAGRVHFGALALAGLVGVQAALALPHFPYYFTYFNPLMGGSARAPEVMMIGLGEGLDQAARYLNAKPNAEALAVASWYRGGSFNYLFSGQDLDIEEFYRADYAVLYVHQWQRRVPNDRLLDYFRGLTPEHIVTLHGIDYAWVYNLAEAPPPDYFTDWAGAIRLVEVEHPSTPVAPGETAVVRLRFYVLDQLDRNLSVVVRLADSAGQEIARSEGWPFGSATSTWQPGEVYVDGHELTLPPGTPPGYLRVEAGFHDAESALMLTPATAGTQTPLPDFVTVDYIAVGPLPDAPAAALAETVRLGDFQLLGAALAESPLSTGGAPVTIAPGATVPLTLFWQLDRPVKTDYTVLVHLIGPDGQLAGQGDHPPQIPTTLWHPETTFVDAYPLTVPPDLAPGDYQLMAGLYELTTLQRLPVVIDGNPAGDTLSLGVLTVR